MLAEMFEMLGQMLGTLRCWLRQMMLADVACWPGQMLARLHSAVLETLLISRTPSVEKLK
jgi:hypothetical protein